MKYLSKLSYKDLRGILTKKGYRFFDGVKTDTKGVRRIAPFNLNFIFVRQSDDFSNQIDDLFYMAYVDKRGIEQVYCCDATTKAGWSDAIFNPKVISGLKGVGVIIPGQYISAWEFVDSYVGWLRYPYWKQSSNVMVWRDYDLDIEIDRTQKTIAQPWHGFNLHRMGNTGVATRFLGNWSEGCMGWHPDDMQPIINAMRESAKLYGNKISVTLLEKKDIDQYLENRK